MLCVDDGKGGLRSFESQEGKGMRRNAVLMPIVALWLLMQSVVIPSAGAEEPNAAADISAGAISVIATVIAAPVKDRKSVV